MKPDNDGLKNILLDANKDMKKVRQTSDAVLDSRMLVEASDLALKRTTNGVLSDSAGQIDLDEFVSKCITFMRKGGNLDDSDNEAPVSTQARRQRRAQGIEDDDEEEDEDIGDGLDWAALGRRACFLTNKRPPVPSFLLGPLSIQKRVRVATQQGRRGRLQTQRGPVTRPKSVEREDIEQGASTTLTHMVSQIKLQMKNHCMKALKEVEEEVDDDASEEDYYNLMTEKRIRVGPNGEPAVDLFDLVVNPHSFGQTVENLFYVSFLIKEGNAKVEKDRNGLPILCKWT